MKINNYTVEGVSELNPKGFGGMCSRAITLERESIDFEKGIETIATTEAPALVADWDRFEIIREVLPMKYAELPKGDKVPLLDSHMRGSVDKIKGSAKNWRTDGVNLLAKTFISDSEPEVKNKIKEGHIDSVSIGYKTFSDYTVEIPKKTQVVIDGVSYKNEFEDDYPMVVRTKWSIKELSLVPIGADEAAKFKSVKDETASKFMEQINELKKEVDAIKENQKNFTVKGEDIFDSEAWRKSKERKLKLMEIELKQN